MNYFVIFGLRYCKKNIDSRSIYQNYVIGYKKIITKNIIKIA